MSDSELLEMLEAQKAESDCSESCERCIGFGIYCQAECRVMAAFANLEWELAFTDSIDELAAFGWEVA